jgi:hypothetical protein
MFIVPAQTQRTRVQRLSLENKGVSPYIPLQAGYRSKKQSSTHIWLHVTSLAISFLLCCVTFMFQFKFYLSALPSPPLSEHSVFLFCPLLLPATLLPPLMLGPTQGQRALSWSRSLYFHNIITCMAVFLSIMVSIIVLIDHSTSGARQGNIKHAPRIRPIAPIRVLNPPMAENHPPNRSLGSHPLQVWTGMWASFLILSVISFLTFSLSWICKQQLAQVEFSINSSLRGQQID